MGPDDVDRIANLLLEARANRRRVPLPNPELLNVDQDAYAVQDAVLRSLGPIGGWKVGAASPEAAPLCAPLPRSLIMQSPVPVPGDRFHDLGIEAEIAFRIGRDLPPRGREYERDEVEEAIAAALPAIEVVDSRWQGWPEIPAVWHLADHQANGALICGPETADWRRLALTRQPVALRIDRRPVVEHEGGNKGGDLLRLVTWLANHAAGRSGGLRRGDVVTTGSCTGLEFAPAGASVVADFRDLGSAEVAFDGSGRD